MKSAIFQLSLALVVLCLCGVGARGQDTGSITGTVRDSTGGVIPGAQVTIVDLATSTAHSTTTNVQGDYLVAGLGPGQYNLSITAEGFKRYQATGITLRVAQKARADALLQVGAATTEVTVQGGNVAQVQTQSSELSGTITGKEISQLELNGRNFTQLITLVPGVSNQTGQDEGVVGVNGNVSYSVNGGRVEYNNWEIDGGDNMDNGSNDTINIYPDVDAIAEVEVLTSNYGAQYGRNGSGTVETEIKSGTQQFHGDAFEFVRNEDFNARNFFDSSPGSPTPIDRSPYKKNDFGYTLGGPFYIPGHYNTDKTKTFFFWSQEWRRERDPNTFGPLQVASNQERAGNFSDVCPGTDCPMNPATGQPFPGNQVTVTPQAQAMLVLFPPPNGGSGATSTYQSSFSTPTTWREELIRVDQNITPKMRMFVHYIHDSWSTVNPTTLWALNTAEFPTVQTDFVGPTTSMVAHLTANASPTLLNEFVFSYTADHIFLNAIGPVQRPSNFGVAGIFDNGFNGLLPAVSICCNSSLGGGMGEDTGYFPWNNANPTYTFRDGLTKIVGSHNLQIGFYAVAAQKNEENTADIQGTLGFNSQDSLITTGNGFADFLLGRVSTYGQTNLVTKYYNRYKVVEPYFQDDWHATSHLTLNLGFRLSLFGTYREKYQQAYNFEPGAYSLADAPQIDVTGNITGQAGALVPGTYNLNALDGIVQCGVKGAPAGCQVGHLFNPAPRVGFAWDPKGDGKMAIRGGYGIFFEHTNGNEANTESLEGSPPLVLTPTQYDVAGYGNLGVNGGSPLLFPLGVTAIPTQAQWPYVQQWHFDVQREIMPNTVATISYVGSKGTHLTLQSDLNQLYPVPASQNPFQPGQVITANICNSLVVNGQPVVGQALTNLNIACGNVISADPYRPYLGYSDITNLQLQANSSYNALQVAVRRNAGSLSLTLAYTYGHSIDDSSDRYDTNFVNSYDLESTRASSNFDQRQIFTFGYVWELPYHSGAGWAHKVFGDWEFSGITTAETGTPFSITNGVYGDSAGVGNGIGSSSYADIIGNIQSKPSQVNVPNFPGPLLYNPAVFAQPQGLTFGNAGRNILYSPGRLNFDMGLFKHIPIKEKTSIEFRTEAFNVFNHTQWNGVNSGFSCVGGANNSAGDPSCFGTTNFLQPSGAHNPRILQLGMKLIF
ncbi:MAG TPA: carboxypeptidase regulatory-like domain-containing protein [Terriglobia bacterium]